MKKDHSISGDTLIMFVAILTISFIVITCFLYGRVITLENSIPHHLSERWGTIEEKIKWNESQILEWQQQRDRKYHKIITGE